MYMDFEDNGNYVKVTEAELRRYYRKHVKHWPNFEDWLFDMRYYGMLRNRL